MAPIRRATQLAILALSVESVSALPGGQSRTTVSASSTAPSSSTTQAPDALTTAVVPVYLWSMAESLLSHYYPTSTPLNLADVTLPATVVIGTVTYKSQDASATAQTTSASSAASSSSPSPTSSAEKSTPSNKDQQGDKRLGIIIGVVVGAVALALMAVLLCCLRRRKEKNGSFFLRRSSPSMSSSASRRAVAFSSDRNSWGHTDTSQMHNGAAALAAADLHHPHGSSSSDDRPFETPNERPNGRLGHNGIAELDHGEPAQRHSFTNLRDGRPPTPFMMEPMPSDAVHQQQMQQRTPISPIQHQHSHNPFASPEDREAEDVVSPIVPPKAWSRRDSPNIHYPSMTEVTSFDFSDDERQLDGGDGWRRPKRGGNRSFEMA